MKILQEDEVDAVSGAADGCMYDGKLYSSGAVVSIPNSGGQYQRCMSGGSGYYYWSEPFYL